MGKNIITSKYLLASKSYYHSAFRWCVKKRQPVPQRENLLYLCRDSRVYFLFVMFLLTSQWLTYFGQQFEETQLDWHRIFAHGFAAVVGFPGPYFPKNSANRVLYAFFLLAYQLFVIIISSVALVFVTTPILQPQIESVREIVSKEFKLVGNQFVFTKLLEKSQVISKSLFLLIVLKFELMEFLICRFIQKNFWKHLRSQTIQMTICISLNGTINLPLRPFIECSPDLAQSLIALINSKIFTNIRCQF